MVLYYLNNYVGLKSYVNSTAGNFCSSSVPNLNNVCCLFHNKLGAVQMREREREREREIVHGSHSVHVVAVMLYH